MKWEKTKFGTLFSAPTRNGVYKSKEEHGKGVKIVNMGEIFGYDFIGKQDMQRIAMSEHEMELSGLQENDLLFARRSLVESGAGKASIVKGLSEPTTFESSIIRVRLNSEICFPLFYFYWLRSHAGRTAIGALVTGTNVKGIRGSALKDIDVDFPPTEIQRRIASILSAYDDLIENNQKQIKLLEEATQRLYKEWFVDLRFPGWETAEIVDGVPVGWSQKQIYEVAEIKAGGDKPEIVSNRATEHTPVPIYANGIEQEGLYGYTNKAIINKESVTISARGTVGFVFLRRTPYVPIVRLLSVIPYDIPALYLYYCLKNTSFERNGTSQQQITVSMVKNKELIIAEKSIIESFAKIVNNYHDKIDSLKAQIKYLSEARDRLLPKLMSGELEV